MNFITFFVVFIFFFVSAKTVPLLSGEGPTETSTPPSTTLSATPSATPTITARSCGDPGSPFNGKRIGMLFQSGNTVRFTCNKGYYLQGPATRTCQANQTWTGFQPLCKPISCGEPPKVSHADIFLYGSGDYVYGSLIEFTCKPGFYKEGDQVMNCGDDGKWHGSPPVCKEVRCPQPKPLLNGTIQISNTTEGGVVRYTCNPGYKLFGPHWRKCLKSRTWTGPEPTCFECAGVGTPVFVRKPSHFKHGVVKSKSGNQVTVYYKAEDKEEDITIIGRGTQHYIIVEDRIPSKEEIFIGSRVLAANSQRRRYMFATVRSIDGDLYRVQFDWNMLGKIDVPLDEIRTLEPPRFCATCSDPGRPVFSSREDDLTEFIPGMEVIYTCQYTYKMSGSQTRQCQKDGTWTGTTPTCTAGYYYHRFKSHKGSSCKPRLYKKVLHRFCKDTPCRTIKDCTDPKHSCVCDEDCGKICSYPKVRCPQPKPLLNGTIQISNTTEGGVVRYTCNPGYKLFGPHWRKCLKSRTWTGPEPMCFECAGVGTPVFVRKPSYFKHGVVKSKSGNQVTVYYKAEDNEEDVTIIGRGTKHIIVGDRIPSKEEIFIGSRVLAVNSQRRRFMFATVRSIDGDLYGVQFDWNMLVKTEVPLDEIRTLEPPRFCTTCSDPGRPVFSSREDDLTEFIPGMEVIYTCQYTYKMSGSQTRQCQKDGTWTGTTPTCTVHSCDDLEAFPPRHGKRVGNNFTIGNTLEFSCDDGYSLIGQSRLTCTSNGNWSHPTPTCTGVCENFRCTTVGEKCKYIQNVGPRCVCRENNECRAVYEPVCGSDGLSYNSQCIMSATACRTGKEIRMVDQGSCLPGGLCQIVPYSVCRGYFPGYFYNSTSKKCQYFIAGGCHPSGWNGFQTEQQCKQSCLADICEQPTNRGPCTLRVPRWTFDSTTGRCKKFNYGGCFGNENNFLTKELCLRRCKPVEKVSKEGSCPNCVRAKLRKACKESTLAILARVISVLSNHEEKRLQRYHLEIHQVIKDTSGKITLGRTIVSVPYQSSSIKCACLRLPTNKKFVLIGRLSTEQTADRKTGMILSPQSFAHGWSVRIRKQIELKCGNYLPIPIAKQ